jgi:acetolactate synthase-1/2/3 large subunit
VDREIAGTHPEEWTFLESVKEGLSDDTMVFADMCIPGYWTAAFHPFKGPRRLAYPVGWGTLGFAFPASLGAAIGRPDPVLCLCGDGGFLFAAGELATMAQEQIPLTLLIVDDGGYGMLRYDQEIMGQQAVGVDLASPDWHHLAAAFDLPLTRVESLGRPLADALKEEVSNPRPSILVASAKLTPPVTTSPRWYRSVIKKEKR